MAKIGNLEVDTLNIAESAVSGRVTRSGAGNLSVPNASSMPVEVYAVVNSIYTSSSSGTGWAFSATVSGGGVFWTRSWARNGNTGGAPATNMFSAALLSVSPGSSPTFSIALTAGNAGGDSMKFGFITGTLTAIYAKK